jgi:hypothetical protein
MNLFSNTIIALVAMMTMCCASTYKPVAVESFEFSNAYTLNDTLRISYQYDVQKTTGNKRYARKERKRKMASVAVKIENISSAPVTITRNNFKVYAENKARDVYTPAAYAKKVKQRVGMHLLHSLWGPWAMSWQEKDGETEFHFIYIPVGAIVGVGNAIRASNANKQNLRTQEDNEIWNRSINSGETLYGLIALPSSEKDTLTFSYSAKKDSAPTTAEVYKPAKAPSSHMHSFYVVMADGKPHTIKTRIDISGSEHFIRAYGKGLPERVRPSKTQTLSRVTADGRQLLGEPNGNRWRFKIISGAINGYHFLAEEDTEYVSEIQKGDGVIVPFTPQVLIGMIGGDPDVMRMINQRKFVAAIRLYNAKYKG